MFVQSHVEKVRRSKGDAAVAQLEERLGQRAYFERLEDVSVGLEMRVIEAAFDLLNEGHGLTGGARERAMGRMYFVDFCEGTSYGLTVMNSMPHTKATFVTLIHNLGSIARSVLKHIEFKSENRHGGLCIKLTNNSYPPEHFSGFFEEWLAQWKIPAQVTYRRGNGNVDEYRIAL